MADKFSLYDVYEQNLNFIFGAGASNGFLPTLALNIKNSQGKTYTFETLAVELKNKHADHVYDLLFMHYFDKCIKSGLPDPLNIPLPPERNAVLEEYELFLRTLISVLEKQGRNDKKCNIYTTNYDNCLELSADRIISDSTLSCVVNDGSSGFNYRKFHTKNFSNRVVQKGIFDKYSEYLPQINLLHPHGSVYWQKCEKGIAVDYGDSPYKIEFDTGLRDLLAGLEEIVNDTSKTIDDLFKFGQDASNNWEALNADEFWREYNKIPIVNPTKWKFHETVFEEAYYQILRHLSFELEKPNSVLIAFGFSFADEHILHLIQRSLSNPSLTVYVSCYNQDEKIEMKKNSSDILMLNTFI